MKKPSTAHLATLALLLVTAAWGSTFVAMKFAIMHMPAADFLTLHFVLASLLMLLPFPRHMQNLSRKAIGKGLLIGTLYGIAQLLQIWGLRFISPGISGFVTGMYVVLTPIMATFLLRQRLPLMQWIAVALVTAGLGLLSLHDWSPGVGVGVWLTLVSAIFFALHTVALGHWAGRHDVLGLSVVQLVTIAAVSALATLPHGGPGLPPDITTWVLVLYMTLVAVFGIFIQTWAMSYLSSTHAAIVMVSEPVFAAVFAVVFGYDMPSLQMVTGGALVMVAMYLVELSPRRQPVATSATEFFHHEL